MSGENPQDADRQFEAQTESSPPPAESPLSPAPEPGVADSVQEGSDASVVDPAPEAGAGDRLQQLEAQLAALQSENESLRGQYMRIAADFDNFRKRQSRDHDDLRLQITCTTLSERSEEHTSELQSPCNPRMPSSA